MSSQSTRSIWQHSQLLNACRFESRPCHFQVTAIVMLFTHLPVDKQYNLVPGHKAVMPYDWAGNRMSGVTLAMYH